MSRTAFRLAALALLLAAGCSHPAPRAALPVPTPGKITLLVTPIPPRSLDPAQFRAQIADKSGRPVTGATVSVSLSMPAMDMGRNVVALKEITATPGTYVGIGRFTMSGEWQAAVTADKDAVHQSQTLPISVR